MIIIMHFLRLYILSAVLPINLFILRFVGYTLPKFPTLDMNELSHTNLERDLQKIIENLQLPKIPYTILDTADLNCFHTGLFIRQSSIYITKPLISLLSKQETIAILTHELIHIKKRHVASAFLKTHVIMAIGSLVAIGCLWIIQGPVFFELSSLTIPTLTSGDFRFLGVILLFFLVFLLSGWIIGWILLPFFLRKYELAADVITTQTLGETTALKNSLKKIDSHTRDNLCFRGISTNLFSSHPTMQERIAQLCQYLDKVKQM